MFFPGDAVILNDKKGGMLANVGARATVGPMGEHKCLNYLLLHVVWDRTDLNVLSQRDGGYRIEYFDKVIMIEPTKEPEKIDYLNITRQIVGRP